MKEQEHWLDRALAQVAALTPRVGFNVVAVDDHKMAGDEDALLLVAHTTNRAEAERIQRDHEARTRTRAYIYEATVPS